MTCFRWQLCNGLLRRYHHLEQVRKRTFRTLRRNIYQTESSRTQTQTRKMLFLQKTHTVPWTLNLSRRNTTTTGETREHSQDARTQKSKGSETIPWPSRLLQKIIRFTIVTTNLLGCMFSAETGLFGLFLM